ncbi:anti-sigma B factor RsbW [Pueribacillus theae]|uniref:Serine-protein kinase RsbW n=1 Tax=Pueribacillus theae TaxID=2171751 RepID=A0A2U1JPU6_9BACI|nr:anti-sigma B factor RsbW [Pueribacillus theae]PWA06979.1 anti-sigma B factor RsbW [Pueribacillus theae]
MSSDYIEMIIPAKPEYLGVIRLAVSGIANRMGYAYDEIEDIKVAVTEACTNAVNHAYKDGEGQIKVNFAVYQDRLEIFVVDQGQSFDVKAMREKKAPVNAETSLEQLSEGGLGLFLIEALMDKVEISGDSGVVVSMTKLLNRDEVRSGVSRVQ